MPADTSPTHPLNPPANSLSSVPDKVDLNEIIQNTLASLQRDKRIIRCSELPLVQGDKAQWQQLMASLLNCLFNANSPRKKLYLHIDVERVSEQRTGAGAALYFEQIQFYTNLAISADWRDQCSAAFEECRIICKTLSVQLIMNSDGQSGNLFLIKIPVLS